MFTDVLRLKFTFRCSIVTPIAWGGACGWSTRIASDISASLWDVVVDMGNYKLSSWSPNFSSELATWDKLNHTDCMSWPDYSTAHLDSSCEHRSIYLRYWDSTLHQHSPFAKMDSIQDGCFIRSHWSMYNWNKTPCLPSRTRKPSQIFLFCR